MNVDARLSAVFSGLDTRPGFNQRLMDRLGEELALEAQRTEEARRLEQLRHRAAQEQLRPWKEALERWVSLETVGIAVLAAVTVTSAWSAEQLRTAIPVVITALGVGLTVAPILWKKS
jgi:hypothetical protein